MAKTIPDELKTFYSKVNGSLDTMDTTTKDISTKIEELNTLMTSTKSSISSAYQSSTDVNQAVTKLENSISIADNIKSDIQSTISSAVGKARTLINKIEELENYLTDIETTQSNLSTERNKLEPDNSKIASLNSKISDLESKFDTACNEALEQLNELKGLDKSLEQTTSEGTTTALGNYTQYMQNLKFGTFSLESYTAKNGVTVDYYLYIPDFGTKVDGIPMHVYLHGSGNKGTKIGLAYELENKRITPSCICICPQSYTNKEFYNKDWQDAMLEMVYTVADNYGGDKNRISISGHSMGGVACTKIVGKHPGVFSCVVPISGLSYADHGPGLLTTKIWAFHGARDNTCSYNTQVSCITNLQRAGADAHLYTYEKEGHGWVQNYTFEREFPDPDTGEMTTVLDWCAKQTTNKTA